MNMRTFEIQRVILLWLIDTLDALGYIATRLESKKIVGI
jgi:hypothetical protein